LPVVRAAAAAAAVVAAAVFFDFGFGPDDVVVAGMVVEWFGKIKMLTENVPLARGGPIFLLSAGAPTGERGLPIGEILTSD
jgi:hypothetical protein